MRYKVDWERTAEQELARIWVQYAAERAAISAAQIQIDKILASDPLGKAQSLSEDLYALNVPPLRVLFEVDLKARTVQVTGLAKFK